MWQTTLLIVIGGGTTRITRIEIVTTQFLQFMAAL